MTTKTGHERNRPSIGATLWVFLRMRGLELSGNACDRAEHKADSASIIGDHRNAATGYEKAMKIAQKMHDSNRELKLRVLAANSYEDCAADFKNFARSLKFSYPERSRALELAAFGYYFRAAKLVNESRDKSFSRRAIKLMGEAKDSYTRAAEYGSPINKEMRICGIPHALSTFYKLAIELGLYGSNRH